MTSVASAWSRGDVDALANLASRQGITLEVDGTHVGSISARQVAAVLKRVFDDRRTIKATAGTSRMLPGTSSRAYAEVVWERRARGTTESERVNVFFALAKESDGWHITEIRLMQ
jgi:ketosteroid isomerase-like protein